MPHGRRQNDPIALQQIHQQQRKDPPFGADENRLMILRRVAQMRPIWGQQVPRGPAAFLRDRDPPMIGALQAARCRRRGYPLVPGAVRAIPLPA
jgi:hypothetical protein